MIKVGFLVDSYIQPMWVYRMIEEIIKSGDVEIALIIKNDNAELKKKTSLQKIIEQRKNLLYQLYVGIENKISKPAYNAFELKDISELPGITQTPVLHVKPIQKKYIDIFEEEAIQKIAGYNIDVLVRLGFRILSGKILTIAPYGVWSYHHGDNRVNKGGPAGVWESLLRWKETGSILQILTEDLDNGKVLYRSWANTHPYFINQNLNKFYWKTASFLPRMLTRLNRIGANNFFEEIKNKNSGIEFYSNRLFKKPGNFEFSRLIISKIFSLGYYAIWRMFNFEQWILLYSLNKEAQPSTSLFRYKKMIPDKSLFWADPFIVYKDNRYYIFIEEYVYKTNKGHISVIEMSEDGSYQAPKKILDKPYHLSYPFTFEYEGEYYMIPETEQNKSIELYKCTSFPDQWEFVMNLMDNVYACDTTIEVRDGRLWLFSCMKKYEGDSCHDELFLFYSDTLFTKNWIPHAKNPIVSDVKNARPAGPLFYQNGKTYRPSQDCSGVYGKKININEVIVLNEKEYEEKIVSTLEPNWNKKIHRTHTFVSQNKLSMIDGFLNRSRF